jgi:diacylglycerol kinase family enzyme
VTPRTPALVILNPRAHGGSAARRFVHVRPVIDSNFDATVVVGGPDGAWQFAVRDALERGVRLFVAAGGDGTAHALLNTLVAAPRRPPLETLTLGAVGLGSSNDLHKPVRDRVAGVPVLIEARRAAPRDIVRCGYVDAAGSHEAFMLISASLGIAAAANARFSRATFEAHLLRRASTTAAIAWAVARTVATWRNLPAIVRIDENEPARTALSSLSVLKTQWLSGRLRFGHPIEPASGDFDVALAVGLGRMRLLADILALLRGRFDGRPGHRRQRARSLDVRLDASAPLELDGEIVAAREVAFDMFAERIQLCG